MRFKKCYFWWPRKKVRQEWNWILLLWGVAWTLQLSTGGNTTAQAQSLPPKKSPPKKKKVRKSSLGRVIHFSGHLETLCKHFLRWAFHSKDELSRKSVSSWIRVSDDGDEARTKLSYWALPVIVLNALRYILSS